MPVLYLTGQRQALCLHEGLTCNGDNLHQRCHLNLPLPRALQQANGGIIERGIIRGGVGSLEISGVNVLHRPHPMVSV